MGVEDLIRGKKPQTLSDKAAAILLRLSSPLYYTGLNIHKGLYDFGIKKMRELPKPVICVGNLVLGGSGKTPVVEKIASLLLSKKIRPAILTRGYKAEKDSDEAVIVSDGIRILASIEQTGDEPYMLSENLPSVPVIACAKRFKAGQIAQNKFNPDLFILDDGFQHWELKKDYNILCISCSEEFLSSKILPAGIRREPFSAITRSDIVFLTNVMDTALAARITAFIKEHDSSKRIVLCHHAIKAFVDVLSENKTNQNDNMAMVYSTSEIKNFKAIAVSGIANNESFSSSLKGLGVDVADHLKFPDHHSYSESDVMKILNLSENTNIGFIITTQKDAVKIREKVCAKKLSIKLVYAKLEVEFLYPSDEEIVLSELLSVMGYDNR